MSSAIVRDDVNRRSPKQLALQEEAFRLAIIERKTYLSVALEMGLHRNTIRKYVEAETERRSFENEERREFERMAMVATLDAVIQDAWEEKRENRAMKLGHERGQFRVVDNTSPSIIEALKLKAKILGLEAPTKIDVGLDLLVAAIAPQNVTPAIESE